MAKATPFMKAIRTVGRCTCQWQLLRRFASLPPPVRRRRGRPAAVVGTSHRRSCSRLGKGLYAELWFDCRSRLFCPPFVLLVPACGVQFSFGTWDPQKARRRAGPTGLPYGRYGHIDDTGGLLLDREDGHNSANWRVIPCRGERRFHPILDIATSSPEVSQCATTALSVCTFPCSKFPSAVASPVLRMTKRHILAQRCRWVLLLCPPPQLLLLLLLPAVRLLLLAPAAHIWATAPSSQSLPSLCPTHRRGICWRMSGSHKIPPQRDFYTQFQLWEEGWKRHGLP